MNPQFVITHAFIGKDGMKVLNSLDMVHVLEGLLARDDRSAPEISFFAQAPSLQVTQLIQKTHQIVIDVVFKIEGDSIKAYELQSSSLETSLSRTMAFWVSLEFELKRVVDAYAKADQKNVQ